MLKFFVIFLILLHIEMHHCLSLEADSETLKGSNVKLVCTVDPARFNTAVSILKDGSSKTTCDDANNCLPPNSDSNHYKYFSNDSAVTVEIQSLDHSLDSGIWKCQLGLIEAKEYDLVVKTIPTSTEITQSIPDSNGAELVENVKLSGRCYCIFPSPSVKLYFKVGTGAFQIYQEISDRFINKRNDTSLCEPYEFDVEVSNFTVEMKGTTNVFFEMHFGDYKTSGVVGPFSFSFKAGCKYSDVELFLGGFSCFLIEFGITSIIMLIFLFCKMLSKIFGDKKTNKIIIIVVFNSFALIIGFALGFGLKECDKRDLGLGLGLGFGFILAIALVLTLYIYHKQCGSKKENEDENRESPPKFNSKKPEDSPKRVGLKS